MSGRGGARREEEIPTPGKQLRDALVCVLRHANCTFSAISVGSRTVGPRPNCKHPRSPEMGKYVLGWLLGVPVVVLIIVYMIFK